MQVPSMQWLKLTAKIFWRNPYYKSSTVAIQDLQHWCLTVCCQLLIPSIQIELLAIIQFESYLDLESMITLIMEVNIQLTCIITKYMLYEKHVIVLNTKRPFRKSSIIAPENTLHPSTKSVNRKHPAFQKHH